ncbi:hypothetical protein AB0K23_03775 [Streptomyces sp. NPDC049602]|uniref:hypothetical protein n=1 Tax=Streptomyces sp. NPDC049602 TaxID=3155504 RepID=UPI00341577B3
MRHSRRLRTAAVTLPLLLAAVGCQTAGPVERPAAKGASPTGKPVFEERLADQLSAASRATAATGSARFTATVTYGSAGGSAVERTTGVLDYAKDTARVERTVDIPRRFPEKAATEDLGRAPGATARERFAVEENDVSYRTSRGTWLRYSASGSMDFADSVSGFLEYAGETAPWGRTLAEVVRHEHPERTPEKTGDGGRRYELKVYASSASDALPDDVALHLDPGAADKVPLTVVLDKDGRLVRAEADFRPVLGVLHAKGVLTGVSSLRAQYVLDGHGRTTVPPVPAGERSEDAEQVTTTMDKLQPGACASTDTGLGSLDRVLKVPCGKDAELRVFGRARVDKTVQGDPRGVGEAAAGEKCRARFRSAPAAWTSGARPAGSYTVYGGTSISYEYTGPDSTVRGDYTCYVTLR